jgi:hypothetical protein
MKKGAVCSVPLRWKVVMEREVTLQSYELFICGEVRHFAD